MWRPSVVGLLLIGLVSAACTFNVPERKPVQTEAQPPVPSTSPDAVPASDIRFLLSDMYLVGDRVPVRIENVGDVAYRYQFFYPACYLSYFDPQGHEFLVPPGTHCDIRAEATIRQGETKRLFTWDLDECTKDRWGCVKSQQLDPGTYTIRGKFTTVTKGILTGAEITVEIQSSR